MRNSLTKLLLFVGFFLFAGVCPAPAQVDPQFAIGNGGTCFTGQCGIYNGEANPFSGTLLDVYNTASGPNALLSNYPIILVVGLPSTTANPAPPSITISGGNGSTYTGTGQLGPAAPVWNTWGNWDATGAGKNGTNLWTGVAPQANNVGDFLAIPDENSQNKSNWFGLESFLGNSVNGFDIWVYEITLNENFSGKTGFDVTFSSALPYGTIVFAEACNNFADCTAENNLFFTPFTTSGVVVPEPASMVLMGTFLFGAYTVLRRKVKT